jgi:hypothetical protein
MRTYAYIVNLSRSSLSERAQPKSRSTPPQCLNASRLATLPPFPPVRPNPALHSDVLAPAHTLRPALLRVQARGLAPAVHPGMSPSSHGPSTPLTHDVARRSHARPSPRVHSRAAGTHRPTPSVHAHPSCAAHTRPGASSARARARSGSDSPRRAHTHTPGLLPSRARVWRAGALAPRRAGPSGLPTIRHPS